jgi:hypothetical protein
MMDSQPQRELENLYFVAASVFEWSLLFAIPEYADLILRALAWMQTRERIRLFAFTVMPVQLYAIIKPEADTIEGVVQQIASLTSQEVLRKLKVNGEKELLEAFQQQRHDPKRPPSIWQEIQAKKISSVETLRHKMEIMHQMPMSKDWNLAEDRAIYPYSSACYYDRGKMPIIPVSDIDEWLMNQAGAKG